MSNSSIPTQCQNKVANSSYACKLLKTGYIQSCDGGQIRVGNPINLYVHDYIEDEVNPPEPTSGTGYLYMTPLGVLRFVSNIDGVITDLQVSPVLPP
jgi:hypothetical protein